jgi:serine/threonine protein kinase
MPYKDYKIIEELKSGGTSQVYRVSDIETDELRVMKITSFKQIQKTIWLNEIQMLQKFQYVRGVVKMYEFGEVEDSMHEKFGYAILELCDHDLFEQPVQEHERKKVFLFLYNLLTSIHLMGYCYCDLKPENILRKGNGYRLCDFSSCQPIGTLTNVMYGTPHVMAPEIIKTLNAKKDYYYDEKIDTWGLGCLLFELITQHEFDRHRLPEMLQKVSDPYYKTILQLCLDTNPLTRVRVWELSKRMKDLKPAQALSETTKPAQALSETTKPANDLSETTKPAQALAETITPVSQEPSGALELTEILEPPKQQDAPLQLSVPVLVEYPSPSQNVVQPQHQSSQPPHHASLLKQSVNLGHSSLHSPSQIHPTTFRYQAYPKKVRVYRPNAIPLRSVPLRKKLATRRKRNEH